MTRIILVGAALAFSAFVTLPASAQISEPATAEALDPNFSIYSNYGHPSYSRPVVSQPFDANGMAGTRMSVQAHRAHRAHH